MSLPKRQPRCKTCREPFERLATHQERCGPCMLASTLARIEREEEQRG